MRLLRFARHAWVLGTSALFALSCQAVTRTYGSGGTGGATTTTTTATSSSTQGSGGGGSATTSTTGSGGDAGTDGPVTCTGTMMDCEGHCVDIGSTSTDCGACGHDCGGGMCVLGQCQPVLVYQATVPIGTIAVSTTEVYFSTEDDSNSVYKLLACPVTGCTLAPRQIATMEYSIDAITWVDDPTTPTVVFLSAPTQNTERPAIFPCPQTGCPGALTYVIEDGLGGFDAKLPAVGNQVYYNSQNFGLGSLTCAAGTCTQNGNLSQKSVVTFAPGPMFEHYIDEAIQNTTHMGYILRCDPTVMPCTPTTTLAMNMSAAIDIQELNGTLYWMMQGESGTQNGFIQTCQLPGCGTLSYLVKGLYTPTEFLVDADGAYWVTSTPSIQRCQGSACSGGAQDLVTTGSPHAVRTDTSFVYWADGNAVWRIAK